MGKKSGKSGWTYCGCAGAHAAGCPNAAPGGLPPLADDDTEANGKNAKK